MRTIAALAVSLALLALPRAGLAAGSKRTKPRRVWFGVSLGFTTVFHPSGANVCASTEWICAEANGPVFPNAQSSVVSGAAKVSPGFGGPAGIFMGELDLAPTDGVLLGLRWGLYFDWGSVHVTNFPITNIMWEARATWVLGSHPLTQTAFGFRPYVLFGFGMADFGAPVDMTLVVKDDVYGQQPVQAWKVAGPFYVTTGLGLRFGNDRYGFMVAPLKIAAAFGSGGAIAYMPELTFMRAF